jgi:alpha-tubulin suppressor-like RCC1 family protein
MGNALASVSLGTGRTALQIAGGYAHTCSILDNASLKCWGYNNYGQLGQGNTQTIGDNAGEMGDNLTAISLGTGRTALQVTCGYYHTCVILDNASLKCFGSNFYGQLGQVCELHPLLLFHCDY